MAGKFQGAAANSLANAPGAPTRQDLAKQTIELAFQHHEAGQIREAESLYQQALNLHPGQIDALYYLGVLYLQNGVPDAAEEFLTKALKKQPKFAEGYFNLGVALQEQEKLKEAARAYGQAIRGDKRFVPAHLNLGNVYLDLEQFDRAASTFNKLIKLSPKSAEAHLNYGRAIKEKGDEEAAMSAYRQALELNPQYADAHLNIGAILLEREELEEAKNSLQQALVFDPNNADAYNNMGVIWKRDSHFDHAISCFAKASSIKPGFSDAHANMAAALYAHGDLKKAEAEVRRSIELSPDSSAAYSILGKVLRDQGRPLESIDALNIAIKRAPELAEPYREMGLTLADNHQHEEALRAYAHAVERDPKDAVSLNNAGMSNVLLGRLDAATELFQQSIDEAPNFNLAHSNMLFSMSYQSHVTPEQLAEKHFEFGRMWDEDYDDAAFTNLPDRDRPLKIGYMSPDFRHHVAVYFSEAVLRAHDREQFEVFCYAEVFKPDETTERLKAIGHHWRSTIERNPLDIADQIKEDGIDILIDLAGHTGNNRLPVFGLKPAPVQVTWIGYPNTTGLKNMDYVMLTKPFLPEGGEELFSEEVYYLPKVPVTYKIPASRPDIGPTPCLENGYVTFGCFNNAIKVGPHAVDAWSKILKAVPTARLMLKSHAFNSDKAIAESRAAFVNCGIEPERIICERPSHHSEYLTRYAALDLALDPFPYNGGTTTIEALYLGTPLLALEGRTWASRIGSGILRTIGEDSLVATSVEDYIARAVDFAENPEKLSALRGRIHEGFMATGMTDPVGLTRDVEAAFRDMWGRWCDRRNGA